MFEDRSGKEYWELATPTSGGLLAIGDLLFIYESGLKIGLGTVKSQNDDFMLVEIDFTTRPRLIKEDGSHFLSYGLITDEVELGGDGQ